MIHWEDTRLGELFLVKHGWAFKGEYFSSDGDLIVVTPGNFFEQGGFRVRDGKEKFYSGKYPFEYLLRKNDLVIAMTEQGPGLLGSPGLIPADNKFLHNQRIGLISDIKSNRIFNKYIYYLFFTKEVRNEIFGSATGTKVKHTAPKRIYQIKINLPPLLTQRKIAYILSAYDDLIENNLKRIKLLEELAQRTYEEWFVKFRINGEQLEVNEETGLPEGWEIKRADELFDIKIGKTPPREQEEWFREDDLGVKWASIKDINNAWVYIHNTSERITEEGVLKFNMNVAPKGTVILSFKLTVGKVTITTEDFVTNEAIAHFNFKKGGVMGKEFLYCYLKSFNYDSLGSTSSIGTAINSKIVKAMPILLPANEALNLFSKNAVSIFDQINNLQNQNLILKEARDILLPRLMNGVIDVEQIESETLAMAAEPLKVYKKTLTNK